MEGYYSFLCENLLTNSVFSKFASPNDYEARGLPHISAAYWKRETVFKTSNVECV